MRSPVAVVAAVVLAGLVVVLALDGSAGGSRGFAVASSARSVAGLPSRGEVLAAAPTGLRAAVSATVGAQESRFAVGRHGGVLVASGGGLAAVFGGSGPVVRAGGADLGLVFAGLGYGTRLSRPARAMRAVSGSEVSYRRGGVMEWYRGSSPVTVTGLTSGTSYTFTVTATNAVGTGPASAASNAVTPTPVSVVVVGAEQEPLCLNVLLSSCNSAWADWIAQLALPGAFRQAPDFSYQPMLVDHVDVATAPVFSLTYHLKSQAVWSDGVPVSADDLIFTWQTIMDPANDVVSRTGYDLITNAVRVDAKTVRFEFSGPFADWRDLFYAVLPQHVLAGADFNSVWQSEIADPATHTPIGAGPFLITNWTRGQGLTLTRNPRWWGPHAPYLESIIFKVMTDTNSEIQALLGGQVDVIYPSPQAALSTLLGQPGIVTQSSGEPYIEQLDFNVGGASAMPLLHEQWFRQAVAYALDRQAIASGVFGAIVPTIEPLQSLLYWSQQQEYQPDFATYVQNQTKVADLMAAHGCAKGGDGIYVCGGTRASFRVTYSAGNQRRQFEFETMQAQLRDAGIEITADVEPSSVLFGTLLPTGDYDSAIFAWSTGSGDPAGWVPIYGCNGDSNYGKYCSTEVTSLLEASNAEFDPVTRAGLVNQADAILAQDVPSLPLWQFPTFLAYKTTIHGLVDNASAQGPFWNAEDWRGPTSTLTVSKTGSGSGSVTSTPAGIDCGSSCSADFDDSTTVVLTATPAAGSALRGWQGDCTGTGSCTVVLAGGRSVTAVFSTATFVSAVSPASGSVAGGAVVTVSGGLFTGATGVLFGSVPATSFSVVDDSTIVAVAPAGVVGAPVDVRVVAPAGTSAVGGGDAFTYVAPAPAAGAEVHPAPPAPVARPAPPPPPSGAGTRRPPPGQP